MRNRITSLLILSAVFLAGCPSISTPEGYAKRDRTGRYDYLAISTDASVVSMTVRDNEDEDNGNLDYWVEATRKHMTLSMGYDIVKEGDFTTSHGPGRWILFEKFYKGADHLYLLGLVVDDDDIFVLEGGGEKSVFEKDVARVVQAFSTLD